MNDGIKMCICDWKCFRQRESVPI